MTVVISLPTALLWIVGLFAILILCVLLWRALVLGLVLAVVLMLMAGFVTAGHVAAAAFVGGIALLVGFANWLCTLKAPDTHEEQIAVLGFLSSPRLMNPNLAPAPLQAPQAQRLLS
jgi:hypothetical protein